MPLSERKKVHPDDAPQSVHNLTEVSKNAFVEPIQALQNYYTKNLKDLSQNQNQTCIFAVRGFIDSLKHRLNKAVLNLHKLSLDNKSISQTLINSETILFVILYLSFHKWQQYISEELCATHRGCRLFPELHLQ